MPKLAGFGGALIDRSIGTSSLPAPRHHISLQTGAAEQYVHSPLDGCGACQCKDAFNIGD